MPTVIVAVTEKTMVDGKYSLTVVKIFKINGIDQADILRKAEEEKQRILSRYPEGQQPEIVHKVLATYAEDF